MCYHEIRRYLYNCLLPLPRGTATRRGAARRGATPSSSLRDHGRKIPGRCFFGLEFLFIEPVLSARGPERRTRYGNNDDSTSFQEVNDDYSSFVNLTFESLWILPLPRYDLSVRVSRLTQLPLRRSTAIDPHRPTSSSIDRSLGYRSRCEHAIIRRIKQHGAKVFARGANDVVRDDYSNNDNGRASRQIRIGSSPPLRGVEIEFAATAVAMATRC